MSETKRVMCEHCNGTGRVVDYRARDVVVGTNDVPETTYEIDCHFCLGRGATNTNKTPSELAEDDED